MYSAASVAAASARGGVAARQHGYSRKLAPGPTQHSTGYTITTNTNTASAVMSSEEVREGGPGPRSVSFQFLVFENIYGLFQKLLKP